MMDFSFNQKITKELILSRFSEEQIMEFYLHVPIKKGLFRSPLRRDKEPTCSFYRSGRGDLIFKDFATGQHLNAFGVVQSLFNCDYFEALKIIANDFGIVRDRSITRNPGKINSNPVQIKDKEMSKIQIEVQEFSELELKWWGKYGIDLNILKKFDVYSCKHLFLNGQLFAKSQQHCPIFGYYGKKYQGLELWRCYFPKRTSFRFITNWPSKKIQGYDQLPKQGKLLVITKSMKDCLSMYSCGITAIAPCSENLFVSDTVLEDLKKRFKYIVVFYDNDIPGVSNMRKIREKHPELNFFFIPRKYEAKDFSDFYAKYGRKKTLETIKHYIQQLNILGNKNFEN